MVKLALIGHPVEHSLSPVLHKAALEYAGLKGDYLLLDVLGEQVDDAILDIRKNDYSGFNVTIPHKQKIFDLCDQLTGNASRIRAVNCVKVLGSGTKLLGHNTDIEGLRRALSLNINDNLSGKSVCVLGSGGACRATVAALSDLGAAEIKVIARNVNKASALVRELEDKVSCSFSLVPTQDIQLSPPLDLIVNTMPFGQKLKEVPDWLDRIIGCMTPDSLLFDVVYGQKGKTLLVDYARQRGFRAVDGIDMLIAQAVLSFEFWTGVKIPSSVMKGALQEYH